MKKIVAFNGSPRKNGNSTVLLDHFIRGAQNNNSIIVNYNIHDINLKHCTGCLRCNILGRCSLRDDDWEDISKKILEADILVFASPIYFHHVTAPLKKLIDRFRSFVHVQITESGLIHTPRVQWNKDFVLLLSMGSSDNSDAKPVIELFEFMASILGSNNKVRTIAVTRLAVTKQLLKTKNELEILYEKLNLPKKLADADSKNNQLILNKCMELGKELAQ